MLAKTTHHVLSYRFQRGFTLIELLVVISVIALLLSILMPALSKAKHLARTLVCGTNMRQILIGYDVYANQNNNKYPVRKVLSPDAAQEGGETVNEVRRIISQAAASNSPKVVWCPHIPSSYSGHPDNNIRSIMDEEDLQKWVEIFGIQAHSTVGKRYVMGYNLFGGLMPLSAGMSYQWGNSGNKNKQRAPLYSGVGKNVIISDINVSWPSSGFGTSSIPYASFHSRPIHGGKFVNTNVCCGDGHVEKRTKIQYHVTRNNRTYYFY